MAYEPSPVAGFNCQLFRLSSVTGILDSKGGIRVVVTYPDRLHHHIGKGERAFTVPGLWVQEPVALGAAQGLVQTVTDYIQQQLAKERNRDGHRLQ